MVSPWITITGTERAFNSHSAASCGFLATQHPLAESSYNQVSFAPPPSPGCPCTSLKVSSHRPPWLPLALNWARTSYIGALAEPASDKPADPFSPEILSGRKVTEEIYREVQESLHWIKLLYEKIEVSERQQYMVSTFLLSYLIVAMHARV